MKDQKPEDQNIQKGQEPGQQLPKTIQPSQDAKTILPDEGNTQKLNSGEDQNTRSANNDTVGIP